MKMTYLIKKRILKAVPEISFGQLNDSISKKINNFNALNCCHFIHSFLIQNYIRMPNNSQLASRFAQLQDYISSVDQCLTVKNYKQALAIVRNVKNNINHSEVIYSNPSSQVLETLKAKNEKLKVEIKHLTEEKAKLEKQAYRGEKGYKNGIKPINLLIFISRLQLTISDHKKVQYTEVTMQSDYQKIWIKSQDEDEEKYNNFIILLNKIIFVEKKQCSLLINCKNDGGKEFYCICKFQCEKDCSRWYTCINYAKLIEESKLKTRLFLKEEKTEHFFIPTHSLNRREDKQVTFSKTNSPVESARANSHKIQPQIMQSKSGEFNQPIPMKMTSSILMIPKPKEDQFKKIQRLEVNRPIPLNQNRIRGRSEQVDQSEDLLMQSKPISFRKASEDNFKPSQSYHGLQLQKFRSRRDYDEEVKSQYGNKIKNNERSLQKATKTTEALLEKKKNLLKGGTPTGSKALFAIDNKVSWMNIEEIDQENKSKSSVNYPNRNRENSEITATIQNSSAKSNEEEEKEEAKIEEELEEESPMFPPKRNQFTEGPVIQLHAVKRSNDKIIPNQVLHENQEKQPSQHQPSQSDGSSDNPSDEEHASIGSDPSEEENIARSEELKKGIILTKCAEKGIWPRDKILYLSENQIEICSKDVKDKKIKKISIANIESVEYGKYDKGIIKHISNLENDKCMVIRAVGEDSKIKNFEFVGTLSEPLLRFATNLKEFVEFTKKNA